MATSSPLLSQSIEADEEGPTESVPKGSIRGPTTRREPEVLVPGTTAGGDQGNAEEGGIAGILRHSSHPLSLAFLYLFRSAAIAVYVLCGLCEFSSLPLGRC